MKVTIPEVIKEVKEHAYVKTLCDFGDKNHKAVRSCEVCSKDICLSHRHYYEDPQSWDGDSENGFSVCWDCNAKFKEAYDWAETEYNSQKCFTDILKIALEEGKEKNEKHDLK